MTADVPEAADLARMLATDGFFIEQDLALKLSMSANEDRIERALRRAGFSGSLATGAAEEADWLYYAYDTGRLSPAEAKAAAITKAQRLARRSE